MVTDYDLQALIDHELGWEDEKRVRSLIYQSSQLRQRYEELYQQKKLLQEWWRQKIKN